jgi:hypothetical protein
MSIPLVLEKQNVFYRNKIIRFGSVASIFNFKREKTMNSFAEALEKSKEINHELGEVLDRMQILMFETLKENISREELSGLQLRFDKLSKQKTENENDLIRESGGAIRRKRGGGIVINPSKFSSPGEK